MHGELKYCIFLSFCSKGRHSEEEGKEARGGKFKGRERSLPDTSPN